MKQISILLCAALLVTGCARNMNSNTYSSSSAGGMVLEGTVVSARAITIKDNDKLQDNALGGIAGGAAGGIGASNIGKGSGSTAATAGGVIAGAVIGALIQDELSTSQGMEYVVKLKDTGDVEDKETRITYSKGNKVEDQIKSKIKTKGTKSSLVSVIQGMDQVFVPGQKVYVIYSDDRPRLAPAQ